MGTPLVVLLITVGLSPNREATKRVDSLWSLRCDFGPRSPVAALQWDRRFCYVVRRATLGFTGIYRGFVVCLEVVGGGLQY